MQLKDNTVSNDGKKRCIRCGAILSESVARTGYIRCFTCRNPHRCPYCGSKNHDVDVEFSEEGLEIGRWTTCCNTQEPS